MNVTIEDVMYHISNSCEGYQDGDLYFSSPFVDGDTLRLTVFNDAENESKEFVFKVVDFRG